MLLHQRRVNRNLVRVMGCNINCPELFSLVTSLGSLRGKFFRQLIDYFATSSENRVSSGHDGATKFIDIFFSLLHQIAPAAGIGHARNIYESMPNEIQ